MVSLRARNHSSTRMGGGQMRAQSLRARQAAAQAAPLARNVRATAWQGVHSARVWAAPRLERTGMAVQDRAAPRVSAMFSSAARMIEPSQPMRQQRRWPALAAGMAMVAGGVTAAVLMGRRASGAAMRLGRSESADAPGDEQAADATDLDRARTH